MTERTEQMKVTTNRRHEVASDTRDEKEREARRRYQRLYYAENKAKVQGWQRAYWARRAEKEEKEVSED